MSPRASESCGAERLALPQIGTKRSRNRNPNITDIPYVECEEDLSLQSLALLYDSIFSIKLQSITRYANLVPKLIVGRNRLFSESCLSNNFHSRAKSVILGLSSSTRCHSNIERYHLMNQEPDKKLLTAKELCNELKCANSTLYRWLTLGIFPPPLHIGGMVRWKEDDLTTFIRNADVRRNERGPRPAGIRRGRPTGSWNKPETKK
jgi:predicted DNA-binding transcriptional regulator AlpA